MSSGQNEVLLKAISRLCGWTYTILWSVSYYPQPHLNWRRHSTDGFIFDFPLLNVVGSLCYTLSTTLFLYSPVIRQEYAERHRDSPEPTVRFNDFIYGLHSLIICCVTLSQFWPSLWGWKKPSRRDPNKLTLAILWASVVGPCSFALLVAANKAGVLPGTSWGWIDVAYSMTYVKLFITIFKYWPQVLAIYRRKSTAGLTMAGAWMDLVGGVLSLAQLVIDCSMQADWTGLTGNPIKLGLANLSMFFDAVFLTQNYVLYGSPEVKDEPESAHDGDERNPLLPK